MTAEAPSHVIELAGELTVQAATELKQALTTHLTRSRGMVLDLSGVSEIDTAGLQLLLLAKREAAASGMPFGLIAPSSAVLEILALARLDTDLEDASSPGAPNGTGNG